MKNFTNIFFFCCAFWIFSCGGNSQEERDTDSYDNVSDSYDNVSGSYDTDSEVITEDYGEAETATRAKFAERRAKGDTLAIHCKELQKYLPTEIKGFTREGEMEGGSINMEDMSYSSASQRYRKGDSNLTISLMDYNNAVDMNEGLAGAWATGMSYEDDNQRTNGVSLVNNKVKGVESFAKKDRRCELMAGISGRFYLQITVNNTDNPSLCKEIAEEMDLRALDAY
jgi:hypothetical protein